MRYSAGGLYWQLDFLNENKLLIFQILTAVSLSFGEYVAKVEKKFFFTFGARRPNDYIITRGVPVPRFGVLRSDLRCLFTVVWRDEKSNTGLLFVHMIRLSLRYFI